MNNKVCKSPLLIVIEIVPVLIMLIAHGLLLILIFITVYSAFIFLNKDVIEIRKSYIS